MYIVKQEVRRADIVFYTSAGIEVYEIRPAWQADLGEAFYREWRTVHNMSSLTEEQRKSDDVIFIYDGENDK